eukprot:scaffold8767_cov121-Isochrysis_galbana.AAC.7
MLPLTFPFALASFLLARHFILSCSLRAVSRGRARTCARCVCAHARAYAVTDQVAPGAQKQASELA